MPSQLPPLGGLDAPAAEAKPQFWGLTRLWARLLLVAVLYVSAGWVSVHFTVVDNGPTMLWLPNGVMLAALLLSPRRHWPAYVALLLPLELWVDWGSYTVTQSLGFAAANALEVSLAAWGLRRLCGPAFSLHSLAHVGWFVLVAALLSSGLAALVGVHWHDTHPGGMGLWGHGLVWWLGDSIGLLVLTPLLIDLWGARSEQDHPRLLRSTSWWPATALLLLLTGLVFGQTWLGGPAFSGVLVLPVVAWIALRHGPVGGAWASLWVAVMAIVMTGQSSGPYARMGGAVGGLLLQEYLLVVALAALGLGAMLAEVRRRERALRVFQRAVEASDDSIVIADARQPDHPIVYINQKFEATTGYTPGEALGQNCRFLSGPDRDQPALAQVREALKRPVPVPVQVILRNYRKDHTLFWNQLTLAPVFSEAGQLTHFVGVQHDITELKRTQDALQSAKEALEAQNRELEERVLLRTQELELLSTTDALTGIRNRRYLMEQATREVARAQRYARPLSCLLFDIDHFKRINDEHGHAAGDQLLIALCQTVQTMLRPADTLARFGGEEFVVLLPDTDVEHARQAAERIRERVAHTTVPVSGGLPALQLTISVGVATLSVLNADVDALFRAADTAMYQAKSGGRNRVVMSAD